ncbi:hypothetical protein IGS68_16880 [Skermanella sp. TT6]|uniref:Ribosome-binding factor A n=1 Tax=Skermanella cutis TaxID=2775420 RepID=A0ABX7B0A3_9PROT|nr:hypothetical protein [Skermanella sp. TT6]QQP87759.1 hypothetical protein IGS68_16880 [Skermanella sp. TT6]
MHRSIAAEILEALREAADHLDGKLAGTRITLVSVTEDADVRPLNAVLPMTPDE